MGARHVGTLARWNADKGYGFIARPGSDASIFLHILDFDRVQRDLLRPGLRVSFEVVESPKGLRARDAAPDRD